VNWLTSFEKDWRQGINKIHAEMTCSISFNFSGETYTLQGKCDRIEDRANHSIAIIDYKTGGIPSASDVVAGLASQLPLEAVIIEQDGMASLKAIGNADYSFFYWNLGGTGEGGQALSALGNKKVTSQEMVSQAYEGVSTLIEEFSNENTPYIATPDQSIMLKTEHNDYAHLERISEWSVVDNEGGE
jgi:ATP-dependent helicase/nuclease subunit B